MDNCTFSSMSFPSRTCLRRFFVGRAKISSSSSLSTFLFFLSSCLYTFLIEWTVDSITLKFSAHVYLSRGHSSCLYYSMMAGILRYDRWPNPGGIHVVLVWPALLPLCHLCWPNSLDEAVHFRNRCRQDLWWKWPFGFRHSLTLSKIFRRHLWRLREDMGTVP